VLAPGVHTESEALAGFLDDQLDALRTAAHGLTDEQAKRRPCRSTLSVGGILKHVTHVLRGRTEPRVVDADGYAAFADSFVLRDDETLQGALAAFDEVRAAFLADVRATDPGAPMAEPPAPWYGRPEPVPSVQRYALLHLVEELARHAGHADVVREELDGAQAASLHLAVTGAPGNDFVQPWQPATA